MPSWYYEIINGPEAGFQDKVWVINGAKLSNSDYWDISNNLDQLIY
jgi:hypothetical protein